MMFEELNKLTPGKRAAALKKLQADRTINMRAQLPILNREQVIRHRLPPHEALIRAIQQDGFPNAAEYMTQLIDYQEYVRNFYGPDTQIWMRPRLINNLDILHHLGDCLSTAEKAHMNDNIAGEISELLKIATEYAFGEENWWWLGHQLLDQVIEISKDFEKDGGMHHAMARYALGKFLLEKNVDAALDHLNIARNMSTGTSWTARSIFQTHQRSVFTEVSALLYQVILKQAKRCMKRDPQLAIKLCGMARKAALDGCDYTGETEAYILEGECQQSIRDNQNAIISFQKALAIQCSHEDPKWKCEVISHLAVAYLKYGLLSAALRMLHELKEYAQKHGQIFYVAQSYKYLGEYYLREGTPRNSTPLLKIALKLFNEGKFISEAESTRNYAAISIGIELITPYIQLVVQCENTNPDYEILMNKLLQWKDSRATFWKDVKGEVSFRDLDTIDDTDIDDDLFSDVQPGDRMLSKEVVLSVLSLVNSKESLEFRKNSKSKEMVKERLQQLKKEEEAQKEEEMLENEDKENEAGSEGSADKKLITLHFAENFDEDKEN